MTALRRIGYRIERLIFGSPFDLSDANREHIREIHAVFNENDDQAERVPYPLPSNPHAKVLRYPTDIHLGVEREVAFRRYARGSGERVA